jgi:LPXTG-motif cell wall-anchored protein
MGAKYGLVLFFLIVCSLQAFAATIHGNVYGLSLEKVKGASLEVNTTPLQVFIATDGTYSFEIPRGTYLISAKEKEATRVLAMENRTITVMQDGNYVIDFILFPIIDDDESVDLDFSDVAGEESGWVWIVAAIAMLLLAVFGFFFWKKKNKKEISLPQKTQDTKEGLKPPKAQESTDDDYLARTIAIIKKHGGRATQKDIRKEIPLSEAKISLLITELEHKGKIEKIKKGRGNVVILK